MQSAITAHAFALRFLPGLLLAASFAAGASAQATQEPGFDELAACSVIYQEVAILYEDRGQEAEGTEFRETAAAFSSSSLYAIPSLRDDPAAAMTYADGRMTQIAESLNRSAATNPKGDMGIIEEWLPFCDGIGDRVEQLLAERARDGW